MPLRDIKGNLVDDWYSFVVFSALALYGVLWAWLNVKQPCHENHADFGVHFIHFFITL